jgi:hypothetical protein
MKSHATISGLSFAFCFCNLLAREYKVRPLCSQGSAFGHESTDYVLAQLNVASSKLPQCPKSQIEIPATFLGSLLLGLWRQWFITYLVTRVHPQNHKEKCSHQAPMDSLIQRMDSYSQPVGVKASDPQWNLVRCRNQQGEESPTNQTSKNQCLNNRLAFRRQKGRMVTSQRPWITLSRVKRSLKFREQGEHV